MSNISYAVYPIYHLNKTAPAILVFVVGISLIASFIQSIQIKFKPYRLNILLLISHLTIFIQLTLRTAYSDYTGDTTTIFIVSGILLTVGQRTIILANYDFLTHSNEPKSSLSRHMIRIIILIVFISTIISSIATRQFYNPDTVNSSFQLRQAAAALVLSITVLFYPVWFATNTIINMAKQAIFLLLISSLTCLSVTIYLMIISIPEYFFQTNQHEHWFYIFQLTPIVIALFTWTVFHPKRTLNQRQQENIHLLSKVKLMKAFFTTLSIDYRTIYFAV